MEGFFQDYRLTEALKNCIIALKKTSNSDEFISNRNNYLLQMLSDMRDNAIIWSKGCQFSINRSGTDFKNSLQGFTNDENSIEEIYHYAFQMNTELYITTDSNLEISYKKIRDFTRKNIEKFSIIYQKPIERTLYDLPTNLFKDVFKNQEFDVLRDFVKTKKSAEELKLKWDHEIGVKKQDVINIKSDLEKQKHSYNFISLHRGFRKIGDVKAKELCFARIAMILLGIIIPVLIFAEAWLVFFGGVKFTNDDTADWIKLIPGISLLFMSIYYFRISLANVNSIKAQMIQISLRMSLCQFIENYTKFSSKVNSENKVLLTKFEDVIFSNIMPNAEKIPSTFDGVEQLAKLLTSLKKD
ncbi:hypothetical protein [uncultured Pantoea sp.]|uniref:hypothetical protein n=1 Tax=uncultured Pantoea sp. TaxID=218084 RepID=UPI0025830A4E|nr:hypothetical protein [uncultured Pantoea sp.]